MLFHGRYNLFKGKRVRFVFFTHALRLSECCRGPRTWMDVRITNDDCHSFYCMDNVGEDVSSCRLSGHSFNLVTVDYHTHSR